MSQIIFKASEVTSVEQKHTLTIVNFPEHYIELNLDESIADVFTSAGERMGKQITDSAALNSIFNLVLAFESGAFL